ncbi:methionine gamma-lyase [candidate division KSB1 bacterium]|nr:MAG: methionine gamma-lyase [candidate division KSB1 bacterium]
MKDISDMGLETKVIHAGQEVDPHTGCVTVPIYQTSTFAFKNAEDGAEKFSGKKKGYIYTRIGNPTIKALEECVTVLENGYAGLATSSGMSAVNAVYTAFLDRGDHIVSTSAVYGPSRVVIEREYSRFGIEYSFVKTENLEEVEKAIKPNTKLLFIETPANPTISITDISGCAEIARKHNIPLVVDNTFMSPYLQRPLELGADIVIHSMTKFLNGHSDVVAGIIITKDKEHYKRLKKVLVNFGGTIDPTQAWLVLRGIKTLVLRVEKSQSNAMKIAEFLENHPKVEWVRYPGLKSHPQYEIAKKQQDGPGALMSFEVKGGIAGGKTVMDNVNIITLAVSLGGIESLIQHPASMTHSTVPKEEREEAGITDGLVRLSVGCEDSKDLIDDLAGALEKIKLQLKDN